MALDGDVRRGVIDDDARGCLPWQTRDGDVWRDSGDIADVGSVFCAIWQELH